MNAPSEGLVLDREPEQTEAPDEDGTREPAAREDQDGPETPETPEASEPPETSEKPADTGTAHMDGQIPHGNRIGRVISVLGSQVLILLDDPVGPGAATEPIGIQIGGLVKMHTSESTIFGIISGMNVPIPAKDEESSEMKVVELELLGESVIPPNGDMATFQRGVSVSPSLGDSVFEAVQEDLAQVYAKPAVSTARIGTVHQDRSLPAFVITDDLLGKHFAVLGTTGSGKSCAVALILRAILSRHENGHVVMLDPHNEYAPVFGDSAEILDPDNLQLPYWLLNYEEIVEIVVGGASDSPEVEASILGEAILEAKREFAGEGNDARYMTVDTPVPYRLGELTRILDDRMGKLERAESTRPYVNLKSRLQKLQSDRRFAFMFPGITVHDNMAAILSRIFRIPVDGKPVTILDLSAVPSEILNVVVSLLCRMTFDFALWSERSLPILLVCEEAHRYAPMNTALGFEPTKRALSRIAKEGRKYGVSLCVVSQRPSELEPGILSQCNTVFALRLSNQKDQDFVRGAMSESSFGLLEFLPSLRNAEAIVVGEGVTVPVRLCFDDLPADHRPLSGTASFSTAWQNDIADDSFVEDVVNRWRNQRR